MTTKLLDGGEVTLTLNGKTYILKEGPSLPEEQLQKAEDLLHSCGTALAVLACVLRAAKLDGGARRTEEIRSEIRDYFKR